MRGRQVEDAGAEGSEAADATDALKKQCKSEYDALKREVMQFLIQAEWVQQEAADQDIKVTDAQIKKSFEDQKKQAFPNDKAVPAVPRRPRA